MDEKERVEREQAGLKALDHLCESLKYSRKEFKRCLDHWYWEQGKRETIAVLDEAIQVLERGAQAEEAP